MSLIDASSILLALALIGFRPFVEPPQPCERGAIIWRMQAVDGDATVIVTPDSTIMVDERQSYQPFEAGCRG